MARSFPGERLKFVKGDYVKGKEALALSPGTCLVPVLLQYMLGWQGWRNNELFGSDMGLYVEGFVPPRRTDLGDDDEALWEMGLDGKPRDPWCFVTRCPSSRRT